MMESDIEGWLGFTQSNNESNDGFLRRVSTFALHPNPPQDIEPFHVEFQSPPVEVEWCPRYVPYHEMYLRKGVYMYIYWCFL